MRKNYKYLGLIFIIIVFALLFIPKIIERLRSDTAVQDNRSAPAKPLAYIKLNGEAKRVPDFLMYNQDSLLISNEDYLGKVYLAEFFFSRCPTICPIMNRNMKILDDRFKLNKIITRKNTTDDEKQWLRQKFLEYKVKKGNIEVVLRCLLQ